MKAHAADGVDNVKRVEKKIRALMAKLRERVSDEDYLLILELEELLNERACFLLLVNVKE